MRMPPEDSSPLTLHTEYGQYHAARLKADAKLKDLAESFGKVQDRLKASLEALEQAHGATVTAMAIRDGEDEALDEAVRALASTILGLVNNRRKTPLYVKYFPEGMGPVVVAPLEAEMQKVGVILGLLPQEQNPAIAGHAAPLKAALDRLASAMSAHKAAMGAEVQMDGLVRAEVLNWMDAYKLDHRAIGHIYYTDPDKADSYFKKAPKRKKGKDDGPGPAAAVVK